MSNLKENFDGEMLSLICDIELLKNPNISNKIGAKKILSSIFESVGVNYEGIKELVDQGVDPTNIVRMIEMNSRKNYKKEFCGPVCIEVPGKSTTGKDIVERIILEQTSGGNVFRVANSKKMYFTQNILRQEVTTYYPPTCGEGSIKQKTATELEVLMDSERLDRVREKDSHTVGDELKKQYTTRPVSVHRITSLIYPYAGSDYEYVSLELYRENNKSSVATMVMKRGKELEEMSQSRRSGEIERDYPFIPKILNPKTIKEVYFDDRDKLLSMKDKKEFKRREDAEKVVGEGR